MGLRIHRAAARAARIRRTKRQLRNIQPRGIRPVRGVLNPYRDSLSGREGVDTRPVHSWSFRKSSKSIRRDVAQDSVLRCCDMTGTACGSSRCRMDGLLGDHRRVPHCPSPRRTGHELHGCRHRRVARLVPRVLPHSSIRRRVLVQWPASDDRRGKPKRSSRRGGQTPHT